MDELMPGSPSAVKEGCACPSAQNNNGASPPIDGGTWWVDFDCEMHKAWHPKRRAKRAPKAKGETRSGREKT